MRPSLLLAALLTLAPLTFPSSQAAAPLPELKPKSRIVFLGDSITHAGFYIAMLETRLREEGIGASLELINLGLPSETCSGLSEPAHPFPRPNVHERLDRALTKAQPDIVFACYGMNDGVYHPYHPARFQAYQNGIHTLIEKVIDHGAKLVLLTPPPFDPLPMQKQGKLVAESPSAEYAWFGVFDGYPKVIERYANWILTLENNVPVIDWHGAVTKHLDSKRRQDPNYMMSNDGVHLDEPSHQVLADAILQAFSYEPRPAHPVLYRDIKRTQQLLHNAWLTHVGHERPGMRPGLPLAEAYKQVGMAAVHIDLIEKLVTMTNALDRVESELNTLTATLEGTAAVPSPQPKHFPPNETPTVLFNGRDLAGWLGDPEYWSVAEGLLVGANEKTVPSSTYLFSEKAYREFRLIFEVQQIVSPKHSTMHSAIGILGERITDAGENPFGFRGPLVMFCHDWGIWDAHRRNRIEPAGQRGPLKIPAENVGQWNLVEVLVTGNRIQCAANGKPVFDFTDQAEMLQPSPIALQLHSNQRPQRFHFRNIAITENSGPSLSTTSRP